MVYLSGMNNTLTPNFTRVKIDPSVRFGKPCIKGTRVALTDILNLLHRGYTLEEVPEQYEGITVKDAKMALKYASFVLGKEETLQLTP